MDLKFLPLSVECTDGPPPDVESLPHPLCAPGFDGISVPLGLHSL